MPQSQPATSLNARQMRDSLGGALHYTTLLQTVLFTLLLLVLCTCARGIMVAHYIPDELWWSKDFYAMWLMGFRLDMRTIGIAMLIFIGFKLIAYSITLLLTLASKLSIKWERGQKGLRLSRAFAFLCAFFTTCSSAVFHLYAFLLGLVFMVAAFVNFYYFQTYGSKIDLFIFGLKDDDTLAILSVMWQDYPVIWGVLASLLCGYITLTIYRFPIAHQHISKQMQRAFSKTNFLIYAFTHICAIAVIFIAARGSLGTFPLKEDNHHISPIPIFNHIATNPIIAFDWALKNYRHSAVISKPDILRGEILQKQLFPLFHTTQDSSFLRKNPPHIVLNLMESFGTNTLIYDDKDTNDLFGALRKHFEDDFVFYRFLSAANGTGPSTSALFFDAPMQISISTYKQLKLPYNPFSIYADAGYDVVFITSGYGAWLDLGEYIKTQGAHRFYDAVSIMEKYPESRQDLNGWGVPDEYIYKIAYEILDNAKKPTFIAILTTSNHPPLILPHTYVPSPISLPDELLSRLSQLRNKKPEIPIILYQYANHSFGEFLDKIKQSHLATSTIIAATGDHYLRNIESNPTTDKALSHSVPFYLYVPQAYQTHLTYDPARIGSHKDIFPTLYALSLPNTTYMSLGGRNMLAKVDDEKYAFGYNQSVWIDKQGIYPIHAGVGYLWQNPQALESTTQFTKWLKDFTYSRDTSFALHDKKDFMELYNELFAYAIAWRIQTASK